MAARKKSAGPHETARAFAIVGSDEGEARRRARELAAQLTPKDSGDFSVDLIDGAADNADQAIQRIHQAIEAIQTLPFFGSEKLVWLKDVNFLADTAAGRSTGVQAALDEFKEFLGRGLPAGVRFLFSASEVDKRRSFFKSLGKIAKLEQYDRIDTSRAGWEEDVEFYAEQLAAELDLKFETEALQIFVRLAGADTHQLRNELDKIDLYLGEERTVTVEVVRRLVAKSTTGVIWDLSTSISKRRLSQSLALLDQLLFQGETAIGILYAAIIPTVRSLIVAKDLMLRYKLRSPQMPFQFSSALGGLPEEEIRRLPRKKDGTVNAYALGLAAVDAGRFELPELMNGLEACLKANLHLVTTQLEPRLVLSQLLVKLIVGG